MVGKSEIDRLSAYFHCRPGDLFIYVEEDAATMGDIISQSGRYPFRYERTEVVETCVKEETGFGLCRPPSVVRYGISEMATDPNFPFG